LPYSTDEDHQEEDYLGYPADDWMIAENLFKRTSLHGFRFRSSSGSPLRSPKAVAYNPLMESFDRIFWSS